MHTRFNIFCFAKQKVFEYNDKDNEDNDKEKNWKLVKIWDNLLLCGYETKKQNLKYLHKCVNFLDFFFTVLVVCTH